MIRANSKSWSTLQVLVLLLSYTLVLSAVLNYAWTDARSGLSIIGHVESAKELVTSITSNLGDASSTGNKDVVVYVYSESDHSSRNLQFFLAHALHDRVDFIFVINGYNASVEIPERHNIKVIRKENECYDLGSYSQVLEADNNVLLKRYRRFILMNASIRGPFFPAWARSLKNACWTSLFYEFITERNKLVGLSANCGAGWPHRHVQSMLIAVDRIGYDLIRPSLECWGNLRDAIWEGEIPMTHRVIEAGYDADVIFAARYQKTFSSAEEYFQTCIGEGGNWEPNQYLGMDVNPLDTIFVKSIRTRWPEQDKVPVYAEPGQLIFETFTEWMDASNFSSYDQC